MEISMTTEAAWAWNYILQKGFALDGVSGTSVRQFLHEALGFDDEFIESTVRTIFLNNSPVDDLDETYIKDGDRMALGSAMPGLVGIVMGRDNFYKSFRSGIAVKDHSRRDAAPARLSMKVFSTLAVESGRGLLGRGILVDADLLAGFLSEKKALLLEGDGLNADAFIARVQGLSGKVPVRVTFA
ncbi:hypothetical protein [uncultured Pseudodesulfovibrio sp.]|uniref:hypothetical protein n=1 Tax=uncultured Pseudodesulfovibrio sp. TaxID=2035858 RepID=UPI0029C6F8C0|nr:hypothetical protein [uncultured Pseudodesulfovibrio sp.]